MAQILNHVPKHEGDDYHLFFVDLSGHEDMVARIRKLRWKPRFCEMAPYTDEQGERIEGVWYCLNIDHDGYEWHFIGRDNEAMQFKLMF